MHGGKVDIGAKAETDLAMILGKYSASSQEEQDRYYGDFLLHVIFLFI
jgi:hypothetical protein